MFQKIKTRIIGLLEYLVQQSSPPTSIKYDSFLNAALVHKCINTQIWHDSPHIFKQFKGIGATLSQNLVNNKITTFENFEKFDSKYLESVLNKHPPFGRLLIETVVKLPNYAIKIEKIGDGVEIRCEMTNFAAMLNTDCGTLGFKNQMILIVGDGNNQLIFFQKIT